MSCNSAKFDAILTVTMRPVLRLDGKKQTMAMTATLKDMKTLARIFADAKMAVTLRYERHEETEPACPYQYESATLEVGNGAAEYFEPVIVKTINRGRCDSPR